MRHFLISGVAVGALFLTAAPVANAERPGMFNPRARLDTTQVIDTRDVWGEMVCPPGVTINRDPYQLCIVELHPIPIGENA